ncbi:AcvB/VirJ family lysyl-phosphatidylglycerol hydrolase [Rhizorhabdus sp.]|uniref:AcvB/VirJ family lysyl-phosphatidylglycerol hydrolase n=1 Tax=Rhizorhabdus sp. TaxID=1968843 RepID=UPI0035B04494
MRRLFAAFSIMAGSAALLVASLSSTSTPVVANAPAPVVAVARPPQDVAVDTAGFASQGLDVATYRPQGPIRSVAIFLSGDGGWNLGVVDMAKALAARGVAVAGLSVPAFQKQLEKGGSSCVNPNYALQALAQDYEHRLALPAYVQPILVGYSSGATMAYAALAQAPEHGRQRFHSASAQTSGARSPGARSQA